MNGDGIVVVHLRRECPASHSESRGRGNVNTCTRIGQRDEHSRATGACPMGDSAGHNVAVNTIRELGAERPDPGRRSNIDSHIARSTCVDEPELLESARPYPKNHIPLP